MRNEEDEMARGCVWLIGFGMTVGGVAWLFGYAYALLGGGVLILIALAISHVARAIRGD